MNAPLVTALVMAGAAALAASVAYLAASRLAEPARKTVALVELAVFAALVATIMLTNTVL